MERVKKREKEEAREIHVPITIGRSGNSISNVRGRRSSKFFATKLVRCHRNGKERETILSSGLIADLMMKLHSRNED